MFQHVVNSIYKYLNFCTGLFFFRLARRLHPILRCLPSLSPKNVCWKYLAISYSICTHTSGVSEFESVSDTPIHLLSWENFSMAFFSYFLLHNFTTCTYREHFNFTSYVLAGSHPLYACGDIGQSAGDRWGGGGWRSAGEERSKRNVTRDAHNSNIFMVRLVKCNALENVLATLTVWVCSQCTHETQTIYFGDALRLAAIRRVNVVHIRSPSAALIV